MGSDQRVSFEAVYEYMKEKGVTDRQRAHEILEDLIALGLAEGSDKAGYVLTERGVYEGEEKFYGDMGAV